MPATRFSGASNDGSNTRITHSTMNNTGMMVFTLIGRGKSGLKSRKRRKSETLVKNIPVESI